MIPRKIKVVSLYRFYDGNNDFQLDVFTPSLIILLYNLLGRWELIKRVLFYSAILSIRIFYRRLTWVEEGVLAISVCVSCLVYFNSARRLSQLSLREETDDIIASFARFW